MNKKKLLSFAIIVCMICLQTSLTLANGKMTEKDEQFFQVEGTILKKYTGNEEHIVVPDGITVIGTKAFADVRKKVKSIVFPDSVVEIKAFAFVNSTLEKVVCSKNLKTVGMRAFDGSKNLKEVSNLENVESMASGAFTNTPWLQEQLQENEVLVIGHILYSAKNYDGNLEIPDTIKTIQSFAFSGNEQLTAVTIPTSVTTIGEGAFQECSNLTSITLPDSITKIGGGAFTGCTSLQSIHLSNRLKTMERGIFKDCSSLKSLNIPKSVTVIEKDSFAGCDSLEQLDIPKTVKRIDGNFSKDCPWWKEQSKNTSLVILNNNLVKVSNYQQEDGETLVIPKGVKRISEDAFEGSGTEYIHKIILPNTVTAIGAGAFSGRNIREIEIPDSVKSMGKHVFTDCRQLKKIKLSRNLKAIPEFAFADCRSLKQITIPQNVKEIGMEAFFNCIRLKDMVVPSSMKKAAYKSLSYLDGVVIHGTKGTYLEEVLEESTEDDGKATFKVLAMNKKTAHIKVKQSISLNVGTDTALTKWKSSNTAIATVSDSGKVTGKKEGTVTIIGTLYGKKYTCKVKVSE